MFLLSDGSLIWMWSASFVRWCRVLLSLSIIVKSLSSAFGCFVEDVLVCYGTGGLISMVWNSFFQWPVGFTCVFSCAVVGWAFPVVDWYQFLCASGIGSFGCISRDLIVLVSLKKTLTLYFAKVCLYYSLMPLMYGITTLAPSISFSMDGFGFLLVFCLGLPC